MRLTFCVACGDNNPDTIEHHHMVPRSRGGSNKAENLITLCSSCHGKMHGFERANIRRLTLEGLARRKAKGFPLSGNRTNLAEASRMGASETTAMANQFARKVWPAIEEIRATGAVSLRAIAAELNDRGIRTARGGAWHPATVRNILARAV